MPEKYKGDTDKPKGVENRNKGLEWIANYAKALTNGSGVIYFADDDNVYDLRLFEEVRNFNHCLVQGSISRDKAARMFPLNLRGNISQCKNW